MKKKIEEQTTEPLWIVREKSSGTIAAVDRDYFQPRSRIYRKFKLSQYGPIGCFSFKKETWRKIS